MDNVIPLYCFNFSLMCTYFNYLNFRGTFLLIHWRHTMAILFGNY